MIRGINKAYAISAVGHGVVLLWSVLSFAAKPLPTPPSEALPVDIVKLDSTLTDVDVAPDVARVPVLVDAAMVRASSAAETAAARPAAVT